MVLNRYEEAEDNVREAQRVYDIAKSNLDRLKSTLTNLQTQCSHKWGATQYTPKITKGYYFPGDPEGTMGIDRRSSMHVPETKEDMWTRTCQTCGKKETTTRKEEVKTYQPRF